MKTLPKSKMKVPFLFSFLTIFIITLGCTKEETTIEQDLLESSSVSELVDTTNHKEHDFNSLGLGPFNEDQGFTGSEIYNEGMYFHSDGRGGKRLKITWKESEYDGTRRERGHEIKLGVDTNQELYTGFYLFLNSTQGNNILNKNTIIWQLYNWNSAGCSNWTAHLTLKNDDLYLSYRAACVAETEIKILDNIETDKNLAFRIRTLPSRNNEGMIVVWMDDERIANIRNINFGFGEFDSNDKPLTSVMGVKMGMYCADTANYTDNEIRMLYLDNVGSCVRTGTVTNSYNKIDPRNMN